MIEELEKKAKESFNNKLQKDVCYCTYNEEKIYKDVYIAGAKENGVIWHDLRKNPNDLPESSIFNEVLNENGMKVFYDDINKTWCMFFNNYIVKAITPKLWCEIPKFKE